MNSLWFHLTSHRMNLIAWLCGALLMITALVVHAQQWSGILSPSRATDWSQAGVVGGIPNRTTICTTLSPGATTSQIQSAIKNCPAGQVVFLNAGTYNLSSGVTHSKSNVTLRGAGADKTILKISGIVPSSCHIGEGRVFSMCTDAGTNIGVDSPENTATWTAGYAKGTTVITLSTVSNLTVGRTIWLDQTNEPSDGYPAAGDVWLCSTQGSNCSNEGGGVSYARSGRGVIEAHIVTGINGNDVTIYPPIMFPTFRSARSPGAWWGNSGTILNAAGLEDMTIDATPCGGCGGLFVVNATNSWVKGVRILKTVDNGSSNIFHLFTVNVANSTFTDNYFFGPPTSQLIAIYQTATHVTSGSLFQNNIYHRASASIVPNSTSYGNVFAYNYQDGGITPLVVLHGLSGMNLFEGNNGSVFSSDVIHGPHDFETVFRNHWDGTTHNSSGESASPIILYSNSRFFNVIGNVMDSGHSTSYQSLLAQNQNAIYVLGWQGTGQGTPTAVPNDSNVSRTIMRWGNWDNVTNGTRFVASEVPSTIANFSNPVPSTQALPSSLYLSAKPAWFGSVAWPPVGPDVSNGNISGYGGHANKIPARLCFENTGTDSAYGSSNVKLFNASTCYGSGGGGAGAPAPTPLVAPSNLRIL